MRRKDSIVLSLHLTRSLDYQFSPLYTQWATLWKPLFFFLQSPSGDLSILLSKFQGFLFDTAFNCDKTLRLQSYACRLKMSPSLRDFDGTKWILLFDPAAVVSPPPRYRSSSCKSVKVVGTSCMLIYWLNWFT